MSILFLCARSFLFYILKLCTGHFNATNPYSEVSKVETMIMRGVVDIYAEITSSMVVITALAVEVLVVTSWRSSDVKGMCLLTCHLNESTSRSSLPLSSLSTLLTLVPLRLLCYFIERTLLLRAHSVALYLQTGSALRKEDLVANEKEYSTMNLLGSLLRGRSLFLYFRYRSLSRLMHVCTCNVLYS